MAVAQFIIASTAQSACNVFLVASCVIGGYVAWLLVDVWIPRVLLASMSKCTCSTSEQAEAKAAKNLSQGLLEDDLASCRQSWDVLLEHYGVLGASPGSWGSSTPSLVSEDSDWTAQEEEEADVEQEDAADANEEEQSRMVFEKISMATEPNRSLCKQQWTCLLEQYTVLGAASGSWGSSSPSLLSDESDCDASGEEEEDGEDTEEESEEDLKKEWKMELEERPLVHAPTPRYCREAWVSLLEQYAVLGASTGSWNPSDLCAAQSARL